MVLQKSSYYFAATHYPNILCLLTSPLIYPGFMDAVHHSSGRCVDPVIRLARHYQGLLSGIRPFAAETKHLLVGGPAHNYCAYRFEKVGIPVVGLVGMG